MPEVRNIFAVILGAMTQNFGPALSRRHRWAAFAVNLAACGAKSPPRARFHPFPSDNGGVGLLPGNACILTPEARSRGAVFYCNPNLVFAPDIT